MLVEGLLSFPLGLLIEGLEALPPVPDLPFASVDYGAFLLYNSLNEALPLGELFSAAMLVLSANLLTIPYFVVREVWKLTPIPK